MNKCADLISGSLEPSLADLIDRIYTDHSLPARQKKQWMCSLRRIAQGLQNPPEAIPARWTAVRISIGSLHHAHLGIEPKTLANHIANAKAAMQWFSDATGLPTRGAPLSKAWSEQKEKIATPLHLRTLFPLMHFALRPE